MNKNLTFKNIMTSIIGTFFVSSGIALFVNGSYGADTISTFLLGVLNFIELPFWFASMAFNIIVLIITYIFGKEELGLGSFINAFGIGIMLRFLNPLIDSLFSGLTFYSVFAALLGPVFIGVGAAIYISSGLGAAALEALTNVIDKNTELSIKTIRMLLDGTLVLTGFLLGAPVGIATILAVVIIGPILEFTLNRINERNLVIE